MLKYRKINKEYTTYVEPFIELVKNSSTHKIYPQYHIIKSAWGGTVTGRLSCTHPNLQAFTAGSELRSVFIPDEDNQSWFDADYKQIELCIAAELSQDKKLLDIFARGIDIHTGVMSEFIGRSVEDIESILKEPLHREYTKMKQYRVGIKKINFGILYEIGPKKLAQLMAEALGEPVTIYKAEQLMNKWFNTFTGYMRWKRDIKAAAKHNGYVESVTGRRRHLKVMDSHEERQAVNFPIQSLASDITLMALNGLSICTSNVEHDLETVQSNLSINSVKPRIIIHDSISGCFSTYNKARDCVAITKIMQEYPKYYLEKYFGYKMTVPLTVDLKVGEYWS